MIANFENYFIDKQGNVYSLIRNRYLKLTIDSKGYKILKRHNKKDIRVHRLVAEIYIPKINGKTEINHINGIKTDNRVENLEWCSHKENCLHAYKTGLHKTSEYQRERARQSCLEKKSLKCINLKTGIIYNSTREASRQTDIPNSTICYNINHSKNPIWKYI